MYLRVVQLTRNFGSMPEIELNEHLIFCPHFDQPLRVVMGSFGVVMIGFGWLRLNMSGYGVVLSDYVWFWVVIGGNGWLWSGNRCFLELGVVFGGHG